jgi:acetyl esterase/lipase
MKMNEREYLIKAYTLKAVSASFEVLARPLWNRNSPEVGREVLDVPYDTANRRKQSLDVFVPKGEPPYPILTYIHGSAWHLLDKKSFRWLSKRYADRGYLVFNINHGLAPASRGEEQIRDVGKAVRWVYDHAAEFGGDNTRIFMGGDSGGAYHSALYAGIYNKQELLHELGIERGIPPECLKGLLLFYGVAGFDSAKHTLFPMREMIGYGFIGYVPGEESEEFRHMAWLASPGSHIDKDFPPAYIAAGELDPICQESLVLDLLLTREGVPHHTHIFPKSRKFFNWLPLLGNHGFLCFPFSDMKRIAIRESMEFLDGLK